MKPLSQPVVRWLTGTVLLFPATLPADDPIVEAEIIDLVRNHPQQNRPQVIEDAVLNQAAQAKADDLITRNYLGHVNPSGFGPNYLVQVFGFFLPPDYGNTRIANNIESIFQDIGFEDGPNATRAFEGWLASPSHRVHVLAETGFFAQQTRIGVGIASSEDGIKNVYVLFTSAPPASRDVLPPELIHQRPKARSRPNKVMTHRGLVFDPLGIERVQFRIQGRRWQSATYVPADGRWQGRTRMPASLFKKVRKGRKAFSVQIRAQDQSGNLTSMVRRFRNIRR